MEDLETILDRLEARIRAGSSESFIADVHAVQGGWIETVRNSEAEALNVAAAPLRRLLAAMREVGNIVQAEQIVERLQP